MSLDSNVQALATDIGGEIKALRAVADELTTADIDTAFQTGIGVPLGDLGITINDMAV